MQAKKLLRTQKIERTNAINDCKHPSLNNVYGGMFSAITRIIK
jgi:hypothetical protein